MCQSGYCDPFQRQCRQSSSVAGFAVSDTASMTSDSVAIRTQGTTDEELESLYVCDGRGEVLSSAKWGKCHNFGADVDPSLAQCRCRFSFLLQYWANHWAPCHTQAAGKNFCTYFGDQDRHVRIAMKFSLLLPEDATTATFSRDVYIKTAVAAAIETAVATPCPSLAVFDIALETIEVSGSGFRSAPPYNAVPRETRIVAKLLVAQSKATLARTCLVSSAFRTAFRAEFGADYRDREHKCRFSRQLLNEGSAAVFCKGELAAVYANSYAQLFHQNAVDGSTAYQQAYLTIFQRTQNLITEPVILIESVDAVSELPAHESNAASATDYETISTVARPFANNGAEGNFSSGLLAASSATTTTTAIYFSNNHLPLPEQGADMEANTFHTSTTTTTTTNLAYSLRASVKLSVIPPPGTICSAAYLVSQLSSPFRNGIARYLDVAPESVSLLDANCLPEYLVPTPVTSTSVAGATPAWAATSSAIGGGPERVRKQVRRRLGIGFRAEIAYQVSGFTDRDTASAAGDRVSVTDSAQAAVFEQTLHACFSEHDPELGVLSVAQGSTLPTVSVAGGNGSIRGADGAAASAGMSPTVIALLVCFLLLVACVPAIGVVLRRYEMLSPAWTARVDWFQRQLLHPFYNKLLALTHPPVARGYLKPERAEKNQLRFGKKATSGDVAESKNSRGKYVDEEISSVAGESEDGSFGAAFPSRSDLEWSSSPSNKLSDTTTSAAARSRDNLHRAPFVAETKDNQNATKDTSLSTSNNKMLRFNNVEGDEVEEAAGMKHEKETRSCSSSTTIRNERTTDPGSADAAGLESPTKPTGGGGTIYLQDLAALGKTAPRYVKNNFDRVLNRVRCGFSGLLQSGKSRQHTGKVAPASSALSNGCGSSAGRYHLDREAQADAVGGHLHITVEKSQSGIDSVSADTRLRETSTAKGGEINSISAAIEARASAADRNSDQEPIFARPFETGAASSWEPPDPENFQATILSAIDEKGESPYLISHFSPLRPAGVDNIPVPALLRNGGVMRAASQLLPQSPPEPDEKQSNTGQVHLGSQALAIPPANSSGILHTVGTAGGHTEPQHATESEIAQQHEHYMLYNMQAVQELHLQQQVTNQWQAPQHLHQQQHQVLFGRRQQEATSGAAAVGQSHYHPAQSATSTAAHVLVKAQNSQMRMTLDAGNVYHQQQLQRQLGSFWMT
ncbi:unnamed protein product [Amoebophrya sp. A120]|nr:unnamed protein product [Amoebophrya sp. A120]|eukprot:GSA120T00015118001.1